MKNVSSAQITAGVLTQNFSQTVSFFITKDDAYNFMSPIKGTRAY